jgi:hypothetical protein
MNFYLLGIIILLITFFDSFLLYKYFEESILNFGDNRNAIELLILYILFLRINNILV